MKEKHDVMTLIIPLFDRPAEFALIEKLLMDNSHLPGPRGNLSLAFRFAGGFAAASVNEDLWHLLTMWANTSAEEAPVNSPGEYLPFCAVLAFGAHYPYAGSKFKAAIMDQIRKAMNDKRWRVREASAMACQLIAEKDFAPVKHYFTMWYDDANYLEKRAFVAALAHPPILGKEEIARFSLTISEKILNDILSSSTAGRRSEDFTVLSKGLQYALSVFVARRPGDGFKLLKHYAGSGDPDIQTIIKANLGKSRLKSKYAPMVNEILATMR